ncbi:hypothetical protein [Guptibacillus sedimenti]|uniref:hypothetical protein n=1 Tax=Guptibacillus sedimenti TaxID=3025680 RepID=UPI002361B138|nr:hypothetical protein [Pseudalkalibacillus sedimenti]
MTIIWAFFVAITALLAQMEISLPLVTISGGVYPFIIVGLIKAFLASWLGITIRRRLIQARLLQRTIGTIQSKN